MSERWRQLSERQIAESLLAQGRTVEEIQAAIRLKRQTLKAEAEREAESGSERVGFLASAEWWLCVAGWLRRS